MKLTPLTRRHVLLTLSVDIPACVHGHRVMRHVSLLNPSYPFSGHFTGQKLSAGASEASEHAIQLHKHRQRKAFLTEWKIDTALIGMLGQIRNILIILLLLFVLFFYVQCRVQFF